MATQLKQVAAGEGNQTNAIGGAQITIKANSNDTGAAFTVVETITPPLAGPPLHVHRRKDESFYVCNGRVIRPARVTPTGDDTQARWNSPRFTNRAQR